MIDKDFVKNYYTHETVLRSIKIDNQTSSLVIEFLYCEWQLEESRGVKGYKMMFEGVKELSNSDFMKQNNVFVLSFQVSKGTAYIYLENDMDLKFKYKKYVIEEIV